MAQPLPTQQYQKVELFKAEILGVGSYGAVCKAKYNELPCAAKILHPVMFQFNDPGALAFLRKFEQECQFLRTIKHPNIVQYVATSRDSESGLPVLLMELMDESLTNFLERSQQPLLYHTQVNLCHDIALAVEYLHSKGIVHRDLSSNNVLLAAGSRAKVTDFGMSKLIDTNPRMTPLTKCPGTVVYMSPEAMRDPPVYTEKLDCFSEGVLIIQIITQQFPNPAPAVRMIEDPRFPLGRIQVLVPETERRQSHINLIDSAHPLLPPALKCLEYNEEDRPSAQELCRCVATLKEAQWYVQSVQIQTLQEQLLASERENHQLRQQLREKDQAIEAQGRQLRLHEERLSEKEGLVQQLQHQVRVSDDSSTRQIAGGETRKGFELQWKSYEIKHHVASPQPAVDGKMVYFRPLTGNAVLAYDSESEKWSELPECSHSFYALAIVNGLLTAIGGKDGGAPTNKLFSLTGAWLWRKWVEQFPPMPTKRYFVTAVCTGRHLIIAGGDTGTRFAISKVEVMNTDTLQWATASSLPHPVRIANATLCGNNLFLLGGNDHGEGSRSVVTCSLNALLQSIDSLQVWQKAADLPVTFSFSVTLQGHLLAIGGKDSTGKKTTAVHRYNSATNSWEVVSHTPTACSLCAVAVLPGNRLMAASENIVQIGTLH